MQIKINRRLNYRSSNRLLFLLIIEDVLHTERDLGRWQFFFFIEHRPVSIILLAVSGGKLTFRSAFELDGDTEFSSDILKCR